MENKFISYSDPTNSFDLGSVDLNKQFAKLTDREKLMVEARCLGMNHVPVSIIQFLEDPYYLGDPKITNNGLQVFSFWKDKMTEVFPTPVITKYPYLNWGGAIGTGKSTVSKYIGLYHYHRLDCCSNVFSSLGLAGGTKIAFGFFHASEETAKRDFVYFFKTVMEISPYFKNLYNNPPIRLIASGPKSTGSVIGTQLIYTVLSEIGFWKPSDAMNKIAEVLIRYKSRFVTKRFNFGGVICDSSAKDESSSASQKFDESVPESEEFRLSPAQWLVRPELYRESGGKTFDFYRGDGKRTPHIVGEMEDRSELDKDRIIKVPIQCKFDFLNAPERALQDLAGIPYTSKDLFFGGDITKLIKCSSIVNQIPDIIEVDFFDKSDTIFDKVYPMVSKIPRGINIFVHYDIGLKSDICGIAICYYDGEVFDEGKYSNTSYPKFKFPLVVGVSRKKGQATSLDHLFQFIKQLSENYLVHFSADSFASAGIFQSCERFSIDHEVVSVDRTSEPAFMFKNVINTERATLPYNSRLLRECFELRVLNDGKKIDHPLVSSCYDFDYKNAQGEMPGSKDLADACEGALYSCYKKYSENMEGGGAAMKQLDLVSKMTNNAREESNKQIQNMVEGIFGEW